MASPLRRRRPSRIFAHCLHAALLLSLFLQLYLGYCLLVFGYLPLPTSLVEKALQRRLPAETSLRAEEYQFHPSHGILALGLTLRVDGFEQAVFEAEHLRYRPRPFGKADTRSGGHEIVLSRGTLYLPAVYSPSGARTALLKKISADLQLGDDHISLNAFAARHREIFLRGTAEIPLAPSVADAQGLNEVPISDWLENSFTFAQALLRHGDRIDALIDPTLVFRLATSQEDGLQLRSRLSSRRLDSGHLTARHLSFETDLRLVEGVLFADAPVLFSAAEISSPPLGLRGSSVRARFSGGALPDLFSGAWPDVELAANSLELEEIALTHPSLRLASGRWPNLSFAGTTSGLDGAVHVDGALDLSSRSGTVQVHGNANMLRILNRGNTSPLPEIVFTQTPYCRLALKFDDDFRIGEATFTAEVDDLSLEGVTFDHLRAKGAFDGTRLRISKLSLQRDWQWLDLGFTLDRVSQDYRVSLVGSAKPDDYNALLPHWWANIFKHFDFEQSRNAYGDFIIHGNLGERAAKLYFGHVRAEEVSYKNVFIETGHMMVRGRGPYSEIYDIHLKQENGWVRGSIHFTSRLDEISGPVSTRFNLAARLALQDAKQLFGGKTATILNDFASTEPVEAAIDAAVFNPDYPRFVDRTYANVTARFSEPLAYRGVPLDYLSFNLHGRLEQTFLRDIELGFAGGTVEGSADLTTAGADAPHLRVRAGLRQADQAKAAALLTSLVGNEKNRPNDRETEGTGSLDLDWHAEGPADDLFGFRGFGRFRLENEKLAEIQLFGPISKLLQQARLGYTTFALETMQGLFQLSADQLRFDELAVDGPRTRIEALGLLGLTDQSLAMQVSVYLFGNAGNPDSRLRRFGDWVTRPIPNLLEFELTGTLDNQKWRSLYDPRNLLPLP